MPKPDAYEQWKQQIMNAPASPAPVTPSANEPSIREAPGFLGRVAERAGGFAPPTSPMNIVQDVLSGINLPFAGVGETVDTAAKAAGLPTGGGDRTGGIFERFAQRQASPGDLAELAMLSPRIASSLARAPFKAFGAARNLGRDVAAGRAAAAAENAAPLVRPPLALPPGPAPEPVRVPLGRAPGFIMRPGEPGQVRGPAVKGGGERPLEPRPIPMPTPEPPIGPAPPPEPVTYGRPETTMPAARPTPMPERPVPEHGAPLESVAALIQKHRGALQPAQLSQLNQLSNAYNRLPDGPDKQRALDAIYDMLLNL